MKETVEHNNRFYTNEKGEIKTENEQLKEWLTIANKENERLNNIIDKARNQLEEIEKKYGYILGDVIFTLMRKDLDKELKGSNKSE